MSLGSNWRDFRARLAVMSATQRFEQLVTFALSLLLVIILDLEKTDAATIGALGFVTLALGLISWLIRNQEMGRGCARRPRAATRLAGRGRMARPERFERPTPRFVVWCSIQLSYGRVRPAT